MTHSKPFVHKLVAKGDIPLYFITCKDSQGRHCYYYLTSTPEKMRRYESVRAGSFDVNDFGEIIVSGYGKTPSQNVKRILKEKYGVTS
ncbi:MAG: hypothetical protein SFT92_08610 [Rickettsiales bacterium]|nr:hypothetical protein [Rickettsiales bacterium]